MGLEEPLQLHDLWGLHAILQKVLTHVIRKLYVRMRPGRQRAPNAAAKTQTLAIGKRGRGHARRPCVVVCARGTRSWTARGHCWSSWTPASPRPADNRPTTLSRAGARRSMERELSEHMQHRYEHSQASGCGVVSVWPREADPHTHLRSTCGSSPGFCYRYDGVLRRPAVHHVQRAHLRRGK